MAKECTLSDEFWKEHRKNMRYAYQNRALNQCGKKHVTELTPEDTTSILSGILKDYNVRSCAEKHREIFQDTFKKELRCIKRK